ncbi:ATPase [Perilla frutescens var. frutescens]|nr:ATPase [Perilla frutescens var. frutescens]
MDERDAAIREKLNSVKDTSGEVKQLEEQATAVMKAAKAEISAALNKMKKETQVEVEEKLAERRKKIEAELRHWPVSKSRKRRLSRPSIRRLPLSVRILSTKFSLFKNIQSLFQFPFLLLCILLSLVNVT